MLPLHRNVGDAFDKEQSTFVAILIAQGKPQHWKLYIVDKSIENQYVLIPGQNKVSFKTSIFLTGSTYPIINDSGIRPDEMISRLL